MPTKEFNSLDEAYQVLTDIEIADDQFNFPVARIRVPGIGKIKIEMVNEWDYYTILCPMRDEFLNYYINKLNVNTQLDEKLLVEKVKALVGEIEQCQTVEDVAKRATALSAIFSDEEIRYKFFKNLKAMHIVKPWVTWKRYQKYVRPIDTMTIFTYLWLFNFDGLKKNAILLFNKIGANTRFHLRAVSSNYGDWDSYKKMLQDAGQQLNASLKN